MRNATMLTMVVCVAATGAVGTASADAEGSSPDSFGETPAASESEATSHVPMLELSLKAGGRFPQLTNDLGTNFDAILKFGVGVALERRLQVFLEVNYTQPTAYASATDPRLGEMGASYDSELTMREFGITVGGQYFWRPLRSFWLPYAGLGLQVRMLRSEVVGTGNATAFGQNDETSTQIGGVGFGGIGVHLGPGLAFGELRFNMAPVGQKVTGDSNIGALSVLLGYGLLL